MRDENSGALSLIDRLRIARAVWTVNARLVDLPTRARIPIRRELRANLKAASAQVGSREAVRRLGNPRRLAVDYLDAEYGEGRPRPHYAAGVRWAVIFVIAYMGATMIWFEGFMAGVDAAGPRSDGNFSWGGGPWLPAGDVIYQDGHFNGFNLLVPLHTFFLGAVVVFFVGARMWRMMPPWLRYWRQRWQQRRGQPA
jgi:hypothetical protein